MRILKSHPILSLVNSYLVDSPQPANLSYLWNLGSLLGLCLVIQILTGIFLAMHYNPNVDLAFVSVEHIMRDVNMGWAIRYTHANTASFFFIFVYLHIGRGLYYGSYRSPRVLTWSIGVIILVVMMATAFLGLLHSPKWFKFNNNNNNRVFSPINHNSNNENKPNSSYVWVHTFAQVKQTNTIGTREFSTSSLPLVPAQASAAGKRRDLALVSSSFFGDRDPNRESGPRNGFTVKLSCKQNSGELTKFITEKNLNPVFLYDNLADSTVKARVLEETRDLSAIYLILNKITLDYYIGSASTGKIYARFSNHLFNFNGSKVLKNAVKKYGISSFVFMVLELFPEIVNKENNKNLLDLEDFYLKSLLPNYNILTEAGSSFGYKHSEITRLKMKTNYSEERRMAIGSLNKGKSLSPSTIELIRQAALNRKKPIYSNEAIQNMKKKSKAVLVYNLDYTVYGQFSSIVSAANSLGCDQKTILRALQSPKKILRRRWIVKYVV